MIIVERGESIYGRSRVAGPSASLRAGSAGLGEAVRGGLLARDVVASRVAGGGARAT